jgi:hypothetical protein
MVTRSTHGKGEERDPKGSDQTDSEESDEVSGEESHPQVTYTGTETRVFVSKHGTRVVKPGDKVPKGMFDHPSLKEA